MTACYACVLLRSLSLLSVVINHCFCVRVGGKSSRWKGLFSLLDFCRECGEILVISNIDAHMFYHLHVLITMFLCFRMWRNTDTDSHVHVLFITYMLVLLSCSYFGMWRNTHTDNGMQIRFITCMFLLSSCSFFWLWRSTHNPSA